MSKKQKTTMPDAYDEAERSISVDEAHRDVVYDLPSSFSQTRACFSMQMKMYSKRTFANIVFIILLALIPVLTYYNKTNFNYPTANENMAVILGLLPLFAVLIACSSCGKMLPREYHERTIYLTAPLPMYKSAMYNGKFLAGFTMTACKVILAYGVALVSCRFLIQWNDVYYIPILVSLGIAMCAVFFYCSFAYMMSTFTKRGSTALPFITIFLIMTGAIYGLGMLANRFEIGILTDIAGYIPSISCDLALSYLGDAQAYGLYGLVGRLLPSLNASCPIGTNIIISCSVNVLLGLICLYLGFRKISRRKI